MRALWKGSISFGLVHIPVKLYSAARERTLRFRMLSKDDHCPISYQKVCREDNKTVAKDEIVKGFEVEKGEYVVLDPADFKRAKAGKTEIIEIESFARPEEIDMKLFERPYYVEPDKRAGKAYVLLRDALRKSGKVGVARYILSEREHIGILRAEDEILMLDQLRFVEEVEDPSIVRVPPSADYSKKELDLALDLIGEESEPFRPEEYTDTYTQELRRIIKAKARGTLKPVKRQREEPPPDLTEILDLLRKSLERERAGSAR